MSRVTIIQRHSFAYLTALVLLCGFLATSAGAIPPANGGVKFHDIAALEESGLTYQRTPSLSSAVWDQVTQQGILTFPGLINTPSKWRGAPGVAVFDHDGDGDLDLYVTNGPGTANSLFSSQLNETGTLSYVDVGQSSGASAADQDSSGVCFGDIDNDGDEDLFVLSNFGANRLFESNGDGTYTDISSVSGLGASDRTSLSCSFGDVNGDGLLDVVVANGIEDMSNLLGLTPMDPFLYNQHNELYVNSPGNVFSDVSVSSGILDLQGFPPGFEGSPTVTWAIVMVDYDLDGDVDIVQADDQAGFPRVQFGGIDRGFIHILENDGQGNFTDVTVEAGMNRAGEWMGLAFGDLNQDGHLDVFGTNAGDWALTTVTPIDPYFADFGFYELGFSSSRWFLGSADGSFSDPGVGGLVGTPFGWGASITDYDNDADADIVYHGGMAFGPTVHSDNLGMMLLNDGQANFTYDAPALSESTDHRRRTVHGMAAGDLDDDGFTDIVSVSSFDKQESIPLSTYNVAWGSPFDGLFVYQATYQPTDIPGVWSFARLETNIDGSLAVEMSSGDNGNRWSKVKLLGGRGLVTGGEVNRDGIGAVVSFRTARGRTALQPVLGGSSYASQDSLEMVFGLGRARQGQVEVLWPGGVRNRLYGVRHGQRVLMPEIPCSYDGDWSGLLEYAICVGSALDELRDAELLDRRQSRQLFGSAILAYLVER